MRAELKGQVTVQCLCIACLEGMKLQQLNACHGQVPSSSRLETQGGLLVLAVVSGYQQDTMDDDLVTAAL